MKPDFETIILEDYERDIAEGDFTAEELLASMQELRDKYAQDGSTGLVEGYDRAIAQLQQR